MTYLIPNFTLIFLSYNHFMENFILFLFMWMLNIQRVNLILKHEIESLILIFIILFIL